MIVHTYRKYLIAFRITFYIRSDCLFFGRVFHCCLFRCLFFLTCVFRLWLSFKALSSNRKCVLSYLSFRRHIVRHVWFVLWRYHLLWTTSLFLCGLYMCILLACAIAFVELERYYLVLFFSFRVTTKQSFFLRHCYCLRKEKKREKKNMSWRDLEQDLYKSLPLSTLFSFFFRYDIWVTDCQYLLHLRLQRPIK